MDCLAQQKAFSAQSSPPSPVSGIDSHNGVYSFSRGTGADVSSDDF
jgi:hypothetical protein